MQAFRNFSRPMRNGKPLLSRSPVRSFPLTATDRLGRERWLMRCAGLRKSSHEGSARTDCGPFTCWFAEAKEHRMNKSHSNWGTRVTGRAFGQPTAECRRVGETAEVQTWAGSPQENQPGPNRRRTAGNLKSKKRIRAAGGASVTQKPTRML